MFQTVRCFFFSKRSRNPILVILTLFAVWPKLHDISHTFVFDDFQRMHFISYFINLILSSQFLFLVKFDSTVGSGGMGQLQLQGVRQAWTRASMVSKVIREVQ